MLEAAKAAPVRSAKPEEHKHEEKIAEAARGFNEARAAEKEPQEAAYRSAQPK
jgi:hypothetical protein